MPVPCPNSQLSISQIFHSISHLLHQSIHTRNLQTIKELHARLLRTGFFASLSLHTNLLLSYATCPRDNLLSLNKLFKSIDKTSPVYWNAVIAAFSHNSLPFLALETFSLMHRTGLALDTYAICSALTASAATKMLNFGKQAHAQLSKSGRPISVYVGGALIDFYVKSASINDASQLFDEIPVKNTICANSLLSGYADAKLWIEGLQFFRRMSLLSMEPDKFTLSAILRVCAGLSAIELGRQVHTNLVRKNTYCNQDLFLTSSLIEMYGKCGLVQKAQYIFDFVGEQTKRDVILWTSMLSAYSRNGRFKDVIETYEEMLAQGVRPDEIVFVAVLSACSHMGHVSQGLQYFESMARDFGMAPGQAHFGCLVDMLCRAGELDKACEMVSEIPIEQGSGITAWGALLSASKDFGSVEMGKLAARKALELDPENVGIYVELSNLYARFGMWDEIEGLRELMKERGLKKDVGFSRIEITR